MSAKTYAIPDLHGCLEGLEKFLDALDLNTPATLVFLGDYIDRGPDSKYVIDTIRDLDLPDYIKVVTLAGNHEAMALEAHSGRGWRADHGLEGFNWWVEQGGLATLASFGKGKIPDDYLTWMAGLPKLYHDTHRVYTHAGVDPRKPLTEQVDKFLQWYRYGPVEEANYPGLHLVHGHSPRKEPELLQTRTNLDTGLVYGGRLTIGVFDDSLPGGPVDLWRY
jgi:serine/threonine protein phosphatase 1